MPSDLDGVHKSDLVAGDFGDVQVSQMSFTEADTVTLNDLLDVPAGEGLCTLCAALFIQKLTSNTGNHWMNWNLLCCGLQCTDASQ